MDVISFYSRRIVDRMDVEWVIPYCHGSLTMKSSLRYGKDIKLLLVDEMCDGLHLVSREAMGVE